MQTRIKKKCTGKYAVTPCAARHIENMQREVTLLMASIRTLAVGNRGMPTIFYTCLEWMFICLAFYSPLSLLQAILNFQ